MRRYRIPALAHPNILYLHSHDTGRFVQPYGYAVPTPRIQGLAEQGILFRQAFCAASTCSASRACLLTGQYAHTNGMLGLAHRGWSLHDYTHHIVHTLRAVGYHSTLIGEQHISKRPDVIGYDRVVKISTTRVADVAPVTIDILRDPPAEPFFLSVGFFETHREFFQPVAGDEHYVRPPANLPDMAETRADMAAFTASARSLDRGVGAVLDALDDTGLARNTLVICTTDHGIAFPGAKATLSDRGIGVMLILRGPGGFAGGKASDALVSHIDLFPTVCDVLGIAAPRLAPGPLADADRDRGRGRGARRRSSPRAPTTPPTSRSARSARRGGSSSAGSAIAACRCCPTSTTAPASRCGSTTAMPSASRPRCSSTTSSSTPTRPATWPTGPSTPRSSSISAARLERWMRGTGDPLLDGPVAPPAGRRGQRPRPALGRRPGELTYLAT